MSTISKEEIKSIIYGTYTDHPYPCQLQNRYEAKRELCNDIVKCNKELDKISKRNGFVLA